MGPIGLLPRQAAAKQAFERQVDALRPIIEMIPAGLTARAPKSVELHRILMPVV